MKVNKYGNFLTVLLVILIVAVIVGIGFLIYNLVIKPNNHDDRVIAAIEEFDKNAEENNKNEEENTIIPDSPPPTEGNSGSNGGTKTKTYYNGFVMIGYITIPKTNVKEPILDELTPESLNTAVATLYPSNSAAQINKPGNLVIVGHNYRNGQFFSNNKKLSVGDKIYIKDQTGIELAYTIYEKFETSDQDTSFYARNTNGATEITLSTCTDDAKARTIILARVEE